MPQRVKIKLRIQISGIPRDLECLVQRPRRHATTPLGDPESRMISRREQRADLDEVLIEHRHDPVHLRHREHSPALGRATRRRLAHRTNNAPNLP